MKYFYSHLLHRYRELIDTLDNIFIEKSDREEAKALIDKTIHFAAVDLLLEHLPKEHHERILIRINESPDDISTIHIVSNLVGKDIEIILQEKLHQVQLEILEDLLPQKKEGD